MKRYADFLIVGAGIMGLSLARALKRRYPEQSVTILEKEPAIGLHTSGRNSGVLHSGLYYPEHSLKARVCAAGGAALALYCEENRLPFKRIGKVIVPVVAAQDPQVDLLYSRGLANGATVEIIDQRQLSAIEPMAVSASGRALYSPNTAVFDPKIILAHLAAELKNNGVDILLEQTLYTLNPTQKTGLDKNGAVFHYGHLFNTAGLHADRVAQACDVGRRYTLLPFKGLYYELNPKSRLTLNGLIYPVPDLNIPFLGVHFTKSVSGQIYAGPTAVPAFGRENYRGFQQVDWLQIPGTLGHLARQYWLNRQSFRDYTRQEAFRFFKRNFVKAAQALVPSLQSEDLVPSPKVGIRAQLLNRDTQTLVMDFVVANGTHSTHVLNAVSPAFTSAFAFAELVLDEAFGATSAAGSTHRPPCASGKEN